MNIQTISSAPAWPTILAKIASAITIIVGAVIIISRTFYFWLPENILPVVVLLKPNTAICFIFAGIALWIRAEKQSRPPTPC